MAFGKSFFFPLCCHPRTLSDLKNNFSSLFCQFFFSTFLFHTVSISVDVFNIFWNMTDCLLNHELTWAWYVYLQKITFLPASITSFLFSFSLINLKSSSIRCYINKIITNVCTRKYLTLSMLMSLLLSSSFELAQKNKKTKLTRVIFGIINFIKLLMAVE